MALVGSSQSRLAYTLFDLYYILSLASVIGAGEDKQQHNTVFNTDLSVRAFKWPSADGVYGEVKC